ncbi:MAG TPA: hypothetical protein GXX28_12545 [Firmicutes bacterium]|nr:hypothetical protein [Bacillota bacterium]
MSDERKLCPLKLFPVTEYRGDSTYRLWGFHPCEAERCAWWVPEHSCCAMVDIGAALNQMTRPAPAEEAVELRRVGQL